MQLFKFNTPQSRLQQIIDRLKRDLPDGSDQVHFVTAGDACNVVTPWAEQPLAVLRSTDTDVIALANFNDHPLTIAHEGYDRASNTLELRLTDDFGVIRELLARESGSQLSTRERQKRILEAFIRASGPTISLREWFEEFIPGQADALLSARVEEEGVLLAAVNVHTDSATPGTPIYAVSSGTTVLGTLSYHPDAQGWRWEMHGDWPPAPRSAYALDQERYVPEVNADAYQHGSETQEHAGQPHMQHEQPATPDHQPGSSEHQPDGQPAPAEDGIPTYVRTSEVPDDSADSEQRPRRLGFFNPSVQQK